MFKKIFFLFVLLVTGCTVFAQDFPPRPSTLLVDYAHVLSPDDQQSLEQKLVDFNNATSTQIAVVLINSVGDNDIAEYTTKLGRAWGVGVKGKNNGIVLLAAMKDHKVSIQVAYGLEGALPDIIAKQIIDNDITPNFKQNQYFKGLDSATNDIIKYTKGEYKADKKADNDNGGGGSILALIFIVVIIIIIIFRNRGGGGHIIGGRGSASPFWWFLAGNVLGSSGRGGGWGGGSGGGFGGGGGGGGGGFGGFGGGSFGGGGASGGW